MRDQPGGRQVNRLLFTRRGRVWNAVKAATAYAFGAALTLGAFWAAACALLSLERL